MSELKERLAVALKNSGKTKLALAQACGISHPSVSAWFSGRTKTLEASNAIKAAQFLGVSATWLTTGKGEMNAAVGAVVEGEGIPAGFVAIPEFSIDCGAGSCCAPTFEECSESKPAYYRAEFFIEHRTKPESCKRLKVHGDSMIPILYDGDTILVDCAQSRIVSGKIYAFCFGDEVRVKRLFTKLDGGILVRSENPDVPEETIPASDLDRFFLIGRVIDRSGSAPF